MRFLFFAILISFSSLSKGVCQELVIVQDSINKVQVGVPVGWQYGVLTGQMVDFIALRPKTNTDVVVENFNINIFQSENKNFNTSFNEYIQSISKTKGFKVLEQGNQKINGRKYKYLIESHENELNGVQMTNYNFFTNDKGRIVILTMVSSTASFSRYKSLFNQIALTLRF